MVMTSSKNKDTLKDIYCVECADKVIARLTDGTEIYPHRSDLNNLPFWKCDYCNNYVGCHHKTKERTRPLGNIPNKELRSARQHIHKILDPLWKSGKYKRTEVYNKLSEVLGWNYHTANIRSIDEARDVYKAVRRLHV
jgi:hypothetical protein